MIDELKYLDKILFEVFQLRISNIIKDVESTDYLGHTFDVGALKIVFRKSKITPKKNGQFVTLWKRNSNNNTEPFNEFEKFDFCIILAEETNTRAYFVFPKNELVKQGILSSKTKEGKRGFRVYPSWTTTENKQATKTQLWQTNYFINGSITSCEIKEQFIEILPTKS